MSRYTANDVEREANKQDGTPMVEEMLLELARRLRQEEEENRRDPVTDPRPGDRMITPCGWEWVCVSHAKRSAGCSVGMFKQEFEKFPTSTIIRRREAQ